MGACLVNVTHLTETGPRQSDKDPGTCQFKAGILDSTVFRSHRPRSRHSAKGDREKSVSCSVEIHLWKSVHPRAGEMAQRLGALASLPEDLSSIPRTHMVAHNHL